MHLEQLALRPEPRWGDLSFLSVDPVIGNTWNPLTHNPYIYAQNNPLSFIDPDGESAVYVGLVLVGIAGLYLGFSGVADKIEKQTRKQRAATNRRDAACQGFGPACQQAQEEFVETRRETVQTAAESVVEFAPVVYSPPPRSVDDLKDNGVQVIVDVIGSIIEGAVIVLDAPQPGSESGPSGGLPPSAGNDPPPPSPPPPSQDSSVPTENQGSEQRSFGKKVELVIEREPPNPPK